jgi:hypothetical protein
MNLGDFYVVRRLLHDLSIGQCDYGDGGNAIFGVETSVLKILVLALICAFLVTNLPTALRVFLIWAPKAIYIGIAKG